MKMKVKDIKVGVRIRQETGDISTLKESIRKVGLMNPVVVSDEKELVSGYRRLQACRQLGWEEIDVEVVETGADKVKQLDLEYHENLGRADLNEEEAQEYNRRRYELLHPPKRVNPIWVWLKKLWDLITRLFRGRQKIAERNYDWDS